MPRNKVQDLRNHLFAQLENLTDDSLTKEELDQEVKRAKAMASVGAVIVNSAKAEHAFINHNGGKMTGFFESKSLIEEPEKIKQLNCR